MTWRRAREALTVVALVAVVAVAAKFDGDLGTNLDAIRFNRQTGYRNRAVSCLIAPLPVWRSPLCQDPNVIRVIRAYHLERP